MIELGQLEAQHAEFAKRNVQVVIASIEDPKAAAETQKDFPHLTVLADHERKLIDAFQTLHPTSAPDGNDTAAPTTYLIDGTGVVRWTYRSQYVLERLSPTALFAAIDQHLAK